MGIVQDALLGIMRFTRRDTFVDKTTAMNLMMWLGDLQDKQLPVPAVLRPQPLWTGKQILSLVIPDVNLFKAFEKGKDWCPTRENRVLIQRG